MKKKKDKDGDWVVGLDSMLNDVVNFTDLQFKLAALKLSNKWGVIRLLCKRMETNLPQISTMDLR